MRIFTKKMSIAATLIILLSAHAVLAQAGATGPTSIGLGLGGMTEARGAEAILINPALLGLFDGPSKSYNILNFSGDLSLARGALDLKDLFKFPTGNEFYITNSQGNAIKRWSEANMGTKESSVYGVAHLVGVHINGLGLTAQSAIYLTPHFGNQTADILSGNKQAAQGGVLPGEESAMASHYATVTTGAVGFANHFGEPGRRAWTGIALKASRIHANGIMRTSLVDAQVLNSSTDGGGATSAVPENGDVGVRLSDVRLGNMTVFGADIGVTMNPTGSSLISIAADNIWQRNKAPKVTNAFMQTVVRIPGFDPSGRLVATADKTWFSGRSAPDSARADAEAAINEAIFTPVVKVAGSNEVPFGRILWGYARPLNDKPAIDRQTLEKWSVGFMGKGHISPRVSYTERISGEKVISGGIATLGCSMRIAIGADYITPPQGQARLGMAAGVSFGQNPCRISSR